MSVTKHAVCSNDVLQTLQQQCNHALLVLLECVAVACYMDTGSSLCLLFICMCCSKRSAAVHSSCSTTQCWSWSLAAWLHAQLLIICCSTCKLLVVIQILAVCCSNWSAAVHMSCGSSTMWCYRSYPQLLLASCALTAFCVCCPTQCILPFFIVPGKHARTMHVGISTGHSWCFRLLCIAVVC